MTTAVKWLVEQLPIRIINSYQSEIEQANKIFEQQIIDAWEDGKDSFSTRSAKQYYNETFKK